jgi:hypothetical protein
MDCGRIEGSTPLCYQQEWARLGPGGTWKEQESSILSLGVSRLLNGQREGQGPKLTGCNSKRIMPYLEKCLEDRAKA